MRLTLFYRYYRYSGLATLISILANIGAIISALTAAYMFLAAENRVMGIIVGIITAALALFLFIYVGRKLTDRLAAKWTEKNIRTKPGIAYEYCHDHPEEYERVAGLNPKFASKYRMDENGKIVKKK